MAIELSDEEEEEEEEDEEDEEEDAEDEEEGFEDDDEIEVHDGPPGKCSCAVCLRPAPVPQFCPRTVD